MTITKARPLTVSAPADQTPGQLDLFAAGDIVAVPANRSEPLEAKSPVGGAFCHVGWQVVWDGLESAWDWLDNPFEGRPIRLRDALYKWCELASCRQTEPDIVPGLLRTLALLDPCQLTYLLRCVGVPTEFISSASLRRALAAHPVTTHTQYILCGHVWMTAWARQAPASAPRVYQAHEVCPRCRARWQRARAEAAGWAALVGGVREVALAEEMRAMHIPELVVECGTPRVNEVLTQLVSEELAQRSDAKWWVERFPWRTREAIGAVLEAALMRMTASQAATLLAEGDSELKELVTRAFASHYGTP